MIGLTRLVDNSKFIIKKPLLIPSVIRNYALLFLGHERLRTIELAVDYKCQCNCKYCSALPLYNPNKRKLKFEEIKKVIEDCIYLGAIHFLITGGEPLLCKDIYRIIRYINSKNRIVSIATNGILLDTKHIKKLKESGLDLIEVSLDFSNSNLHDKFRKYKGCFYKAIEGIKKSKEEGVPVIINCVITKENIRDKSVYRILELAKDIKIGVNLGFACRAGRWIGEREELLNKKEWEIVDALLKYSYVRWCGDTCYIKRGCSAGLEKINISPYGDVMPCPLIQISFGNVLEEELKNIWKKMINNDDFNKIRERCVPSYDKDFIYKYIDPINNEKRLPIDINRYLK